MTATGLHAAPSEYWHFYVPDCADVWVDVLDEDGDYAD